MQDDNQDYESKHHKQQSLRSDDRVVLIVVLQADDIQGVMLSSESLYTSMHAFRCTIPKAQARSISTSPARSKNVTKALLQDKQQGLGFAKSNSLPPKPRKRGVTEIRGPYYAVCTSLVRREHLLSSVYDLGHGEELSLRHIRNVGWLLSVV